MGNYTLQQAQNDIAALRGQIAHLEAFAELLQLQVDTSITAPDGSVWTSSGLAMASGKYISSDTWHTASLGTNFSGTIQYTLNPDGTVSLRGENVNTGATLANATLFTLPSGYRPTQTFAFLTPNNFSGYTAPARVLQINTSGVVAVVPAGSNTNFFLTDGIRFPIN